MADNHAETVRLLWGPHAKPSRGPRPTLDLDRIARAGIEIADSEGLAGVSMQRVAAQLGVTKMALYRYVPGKAELIALMVEAAIGPYPAAGDAQPSGWRGQLEDWARCLLSAFLPHPWTLDATIGPRVMGPAELGWMERAVSALDGTGLSGAERMDAVVLLVGHVRGITQQARAAGPAGTPEAELGGILADLMRDQGARFPALAAALASAEQSGGQDQAWEFGLQRILDGLAVLIDQRGH
ncbi:TetR/AcrR family transcriptional regulator [Streptomyces sp. NBS 14/10]|uniref:TetR/AcrR family transcriptional regulator n=1 Tax=Streptomyces sp. NBS 14/10 TaxID=1945643 RepID=UPI000B7E377E|nr:TetR/AcrR family transcriptional regulator [Streptomyces sp. NBS 14/10]KAK1181398.1 TetR/AcrR family transcriptional regulator [Streptomyces sp. NBS 14/10]NUS86211.1 TetR/AcrR family transcriptional regulator [Streptomyces sp.]